MTLSKRIILFLIAFLMVFALVPAGVAEGENLLQNADFSKLDSEGMPEYWYTDAYYLDAGYTVFGVSEGDAGHEHIITIQNIAENDARFAQAVEVEPDSLYKFSGYIRASGVEGGLGANLSIEGIYAFSDKVYDTEGEWEYIEYYGETGPDQDYIVVFARLGGYSGICSGKAAFSDLSLTKVDSIPGDLVADLWYRETEDSYDDDDEYEDPLQSIPMTVWLVLISVVYSAFALIAVYYYEQRKRQEITISRKIAPYLLSALFFSALILRVLISSLVEGYMVDVNCFLSWGKTMAKSGAVGFYQDTNFCDYPPLYTYVLAFNSEMSRILHAGPMLERVIFRFIPCICDLIGCFIVYRLMVREHETYGYAPYFFLIAALFNPSAILNSAAWGQMDSVLCLLLLAVSVLAVKGKWTAALPLYVVAVLVKPQALMLGPLGLIFILITCFRNAESRKPILYGTGISLLTLAAGVIPFSLQQDWDWLIKLYQRTLESYPYATVNTANFYYILGGNWNAIANEAHMLAPMLLGLLCTGYGLWWYFRSKEKMYPLIETILSFLFAAAFIVCACMSASWGLTGGIAMGFAFVIVLSPAIRRKDIRLLPWLGGLLFVLLYVFGVKMHERYIFPALLLFAASWALLRDRRILYVLVLFSVTTFINEGIVLDNSIRLGSAFGHLNPDTVVIADLISLMNIAGALYAVWLCPKLYADIIVLQDHPAEDSDAEPAILAESESGCENINDPCISDIETKIPVFEEQSFPIITEENDTCLTAERIIPEEEKATPKATRRYDRFLHWNKRDTILLSVITAIYAAVSLLTLGSTKAPQTAWTSSSPEEEIVFDLGEYRDNFEILYFGQVSSRNFSFAVSRDGEEWENDVWAQMDQGQCWKWKYVILSYTDENEKVTFQSSNLSHVVRFNGRYVKLKAKYIGLTLNEVLFRNENGEVLPVRIMDQTGAEPESVLYSDPASLIDEQDTLERLPAFPESDETTKAAAQPSWWNSSYFDEIYHARTGFEFLYGKVPYETSHPPLGKILISLSVAVFGMCPFGWRFAGALAGILMLPGMYLLVKQLTKKTGIAALACLLMALDCQHLTQTQIATIDSFPVLFIIFEYFFMLRFIQTDYLTEKKSASIIPLLFSGLFMGLSIASKWIGVYAGAGLAVLFFTHCYRMIRSASREDMEQLRSALGKTLVLCLWCILFFILIPVIIYLLCYIPYFAYMSGRITSLTDYVKEVIKAQVGMFNYHSEPGLGMDHPFYSPWWEWPIIGKPMYYASQEYIPAGFTMRNSIFCFGNPVIWYGGLAALVYCLFRFAQTRRYRLEGTDYLWHIRTGSSDFRFSFILIGFLAQYLPWVLVPRGTYIYHYFASLPFIMTAIAVCFDQDDPKYKLYFRIFAAVYAAAAAVFFLILFPYACGLNVCTEWLDLGNKLLRIWYNP
ncbi:phospholipid carrier-dependent glycosyltransferase [Aristaeella hokkaidonensis]|uniref:Phospholipid carrier-dependent glycosyltransferase n=1 Tax=Aristaeella hokkaidonensis TaxID=3046382 RepID=A0AC61MZX5_9FIRM|nr:phospholipid carrier-dependent glycosyltransferase [Aristaeella hokkaidonensis]QUC68008.1 phospholipid carrier-dependent glycosyltransferase [Aristaeella hokkaidonensis]